MRHGLCGLALFLLLARPTRAEGEGAQQPSTPAHATFALIVGVNRSIDPESKVLRYADDDAARYLELFRSLGARSYILTRPDANTGALHPQVAAEALRPVRADLDQATAALAADVEQARRRGVKTVLYFVYAGHGNLKEGRGYLALEDDRLHTNDLDSEVVRRIGSDETHFIVDACYSYFLTLERGPGGSRRALQGFALGGLARTRTVGLLLSTSSARESHEWSGLEAGVFSHEVRSGLYGAADADNDGRVSYREMAAFIHKANGSLANERYRPQVIAHPPAESDTLVDLRQKTRFRIEVPGAMGGHYFLEDGRGIRLADLHNSAQQAAYLMKPANVGRLYLRRLRDDLEFVISTSKDVVSLAELTPQEPRNRSRGAANDAFESLFASPFDQRVVQGFALVPREASAAEPGPSLPRWRLSTSIGLLGMATASAVGASLSLFSAHDLEASAGAAASPARSVDIDRKIRSRRVWGAVGLATAGIAAAAGLGILLWPQTPPLVQVDAARGLALLNLGGAF